MAQLFVLALVVLAPSPPRSARPRMTAALDARGPSPFGWYEIGGGAGGMDDRLRISGCGS
jgi:hypothetical protein